jgi:4-hydroxythreonine-4-phosphate dehydrogenase
MMKLIFTIGDCNGIGIEVLFKALMSISQKNKNAKDISFAIAANTQTLKYYLDDFQFPVRFESSGIYIKDTFCKIIECKNEAKIDFGKVTKEAGNLAAESIEIALEKTLKKEYDAMVTLPISKYSLYEAGWVYPGHTEMLADRCNVKNPLMILCSGKTRVALVTVHSQLKSVSKQIKYTNVKDRIFTFHNSLKKDFGIKHPKLAVLGLNPHAGEYGAIGSEEIESIIPAIESARTENIDVAGPFPADGFFGFGAYAAFDGILAMYHDQGLVPLKLLAKGVGVNFTAGLPIIRTSPDHGTAFEIAGTGVADERSTINAIEIAIDIVKSRKKYKEVIPK